MKNTNFKGRVSSKQGSVLFIVLVVMAFLVMVSTAVFYTVSAGRQNVVMTYNDMQAFQTANDVLESIEMFLLNQSIDNTDGTQRLFDAVFGLRAKCGVQPEGLGQASLCNPLSVDIPAKGVNPLIPAGSPCHQNIRCAFSLWQARLFSDPDTMLDDMLPVPEVVAPDPSRLVEASGTVGGHFLRAESVHIQGSGNVEVLIYVNRHGDIIVQVTVEYNGRSVTVQRIYDASDLRTIGGNFNGSPSGEPGAALGWQWWIGPDSAIRPGGAHYLSQISGWPESAWSSSPIGNTHTLFGRNAALDAQITAGNVYAVQRVRPYRLADCFFLWTGPATPGTVPNNVSTGTCGVCNTNFSGLTWYNVGTGERAVGSAPALTPALITQLTNMASAHPLIKGSDFIARCGGSLAEPSVDDPQVCDGVCGGLTWFADPFRSCGHGSITANCCCDGSCTLTTIDPTCNVCDGPAVPAVVAGEVQCACGTRVTPRRWAAGELICSTWLLPVGQHCVPRPLCPTPGSPGIINPPDEQGTNTNEYGHLAITPPAGGPSWRQGAGVHMGQGRDVFQFHLLHANSSMHFSANTTVLHKCGSGPVTHNYHQNITTRGNLHIGVARLHGPIEITVGGCHCARADCTVCGDVGTPGPAFTPTGTGGGVTRGNFQLGGAICRANPCLDSHQTCRNSDGFNNLIVVGNITVYLRPGATARVPTNLGAGSTRLITQSSPNTEKTYTAPQGGGTLTFVWLTDVEMNARILAEQDYTAWNPPPATEPWRNLTVRWGHNNGDDWRTSWSFGSAARTNDAEASRDMALLDRSVTEINWTEQADRIELAAPVRWAEWPNRVIDGVERDVWWQASNGWITMTPWLLEYNGEAVLTARHFPWPMVEGNFSNKGNHNLWTRYGIAIDGNMKRGIFYIDGTREANGVTPRNANINLSLGHTTGNHFADSGSTALIIIDTGVGAGARTVNIRLQGNSSNIFDWGHATDTAARIKILTVGDGDVVFHVPTNVTYRKGVPGSAVVTMMPFNLAYLRETNNSAHWIACPRATKFVTGGSGSGVGNNLCPAGINCMCGGGESPVTACFLLSLLQPGTGVLRPGAELTASSRGNRIIRLRGHNPANPVNLNIYFVHNGVHGTSGHGHIEIGDSAFYAGTIYSPNQRIDFLDSSGGIGGGMGAHQAMASIISNRTEHFGLEHVILTVPGGHATTVPPGLPTEGPAGGPNVNPGGPGTGSGQPTGGGNTPGTIPPILGGDWRDNIRSRNDPDNVNFRQGTWGPR
jgi:hypothetical protein